MHRTSNKPVDVVDTRIVAISSNLERIPEEPSQEIDAIPKLFQRIGSEVGRIMSIAADEETFRGEIIDLD